MRIAAVAIATLLLSPFAAFSADRITDAEIAAIVVTANQVDVEAGQLAVARTTNPKVKDFAALMVTDHTAVNKSAAELAKRLGLTPKDNPTSRSLKDGGDQNLKALTSLSGAAFDSAYVAHEVAYHRQVLDAIDSTLVPGATNAELKALLVKVRPAFVAHLDHAVSLQKSLPKAD
jgi:putative membrane protein